MDPVPAESVGEEGKEDPASTLLLAERAVDRYNGSVVI